MKPRPAFRQSWKIGILVDTWNFNDLIDTEYDKVEEEIEYKIEIFKNKLNGMLSSFKNSLKASKDEVKR